MTSRWFTGAATVTNPPRDELAHRGPPSQPRCPLGRRSSSLMSALIVLAVPFRMVMAWVLNRTGSLFLVGLAHAAGNAVATSTVLGHALIPELYDATSDSYTCSPL